jgi:hypothetical protein
VTEAVRDRLLDAHFEPLERALSSADAVAAGWDGEATTDRAVGPYRTLLERAGLPAALVAALVDAVQFAGHDLAAQPVAAVPYLAVTGEGVVLRGPTNDGRIVVTLRAFEVDPYRRGPELPTALVVEAKGR